MHIPLYVAIGLVMGLGGGLVGIGGSIIMIPAMVLLTEVNQHVIQAAAMICNIGVGLASCVAHLRARTLVPRILRGLIPAAVGGVLLGVTLSNAPVFRGDRGYLLARLFGVYLFYAAGDNLLRFRPRTAQVGPEPIEPHVTYVSAGSSVLTGLLAGLAGGLLGIGAGTVTTPMQQLLMRVPLRRAMSNSAATMVALGTVGALYKNLTLPQHDQAAGESLRIAICMVPAALIGAYAGGVLMHKLPSQVVRAVFVVVLLLAAVKLVAMGPA